MSSTPTIFDAIPEEPPTGKEGFFKVAERAPEPKDTSFLNQVAEYGKTILKGSAEGLLAFGKMMGPTDFAPPVVEEERKAKQEESLEQLLPTEDESFGQRALRRGLKQAPAALTFPGAALQSGVRSLGAGLLGETASSLGAPEWVQTAAEITAHLGPDITKKLLEKGKNADLIREARRLGLSDEQITPLIQSETKQKWLSKLAPKRGGTEKTLAETKEGLSNAYSGLQKSEVAAQELSEQANGKLINSLFEKLDEMPSDVKNKIAKDLEDLLNNKITGRSLINFYKDLNFSLSGKTKELAQLKEPIREALASISPELSKDFNIVNQLYSKFYPIASKLKPNLASDIVSAAEAIGTLGALGGISFGFYHPLATILTEQVAKQLAKQFLLNPKFQQLSQKMVLALNQNKLPLAQKIVGQISDQIKKTDPESAKILKELSLEELEELFNRREQKS